MDAKREGRAGRRLRMAVLMAAGGLLLALAGCGGGSGGGSVVPPQATSCGDVGTCVATFGDALSVAGNAIGTAISGGSDGGFGCFTWTNTLNSPPNVSFTMTFNNCLFVTETDSLTINGSLTFATTASQYSITSSGFSVAGTLDGAAVNYACEMNVVVALSPYSFTGTLCGTSFAPPPVPTGLAVGTITLNSTCKIDVSWNALPQAVSYYVYWTYDGSPPTVSGGTQTFSLSNSTTIDSGFVGSGTFGFVVTGYNVSGEGQPSTAVTNVNTASQCG